MELKYPEPKNNNSENGFGENHSEFISDNYYVPDEVFKVDSIPEAKISKKKLITIVSIILVLVAGGLGAFFYFKNRIKGSQSSPTALAERYISCMEKRNYEEIRKLYVEELRNSQDVRSLEKLFELMDKYDIKTEYDVSIAVLRGYSEDEIRQIEEKAKIDGADLTGKMSEVKEVLIKGTAHTSGMGAEADDVIDATLCVGNFNGKWKIIGVK